MSVTAPRGFVAAGVACGLKVAGGLDLALVATEDGSAVPAAGVFTTNKAAAAPVQVSRQHLHDTSGRAAAVVLSSGNANAATGAKGVADVRRMCSLVAAEIACDPAEVLVGQTGLIGIPLPMEPVEGGIGPLARARRRDDASALAAAQAIMTTDTVPKQALVVGDGFTVGAMAKGAAMLAPHMATMLAVLTTDAEVGPADLDEALRRAVAGSFNLLSVDGCTSTNDTVLVLASGRSGHRPRPQDLADTLSQACMELADAMAGDAEGSTKVVRVVVAGAVSDDEAHRAARRVAESLLVKCSINGADPYWGRVVSELGSAGVTFDIDKVSVSYGDVTVCRDGIAAAHDTEALERIMDARHIELRCDLGLGGGAGGVLGTDLGHGYIDENRTTS